MANEKKFKCIDIGTIFCTRWDHIRSITVITQIWLF